MGLKMSEIVERGVNAAALEFQKLVDAGQIILPATADFSIEPMIRAVLKAIREPTEAMIQAGYDECEQGTDREMVAEAWRAMCDEMLK